MAGRITASEKQLQPDPRYGDKVLAKFINCVMLEGKKAVAQRVVYDALDKIKVRMGQRQARGHAGERHRRFPTSHRERQAQR